MRKDQLPVYNAYSIDGDVSGPLVYVNYGVPKDYEVLAERGVDGQAVVGGGVAGPGRHRGRIQRHRHPVTGGLGAGGVAAGVRHRRRSRRSSSGPGCKVAMALPTPGAWATA